MQIWIFEKCKFEYANLDIWKMQIRICKFLIFEKCKFEYANLKHERSAFAYYTTSSHFQNKHTRHPCCARGTTNHGQDHQWVNETRPLRGRAPNWTRDIARQHSTRRCKYRYEPYGLKEREKTRNNNGCVWRLSLKKKMFCIPECMHMHTSISSACVYIHTHHVEAIAYSSCMHAPSQKTVSSTLEARLR